MSIRQGIRGASAALVAGLALASATDAAHASLSAPTPRAIAWVDGKALLAKSPAHPKPRVIARGAAQNVTWSPNGRWLAFAGAGGIHIVTAAGRLRRVLGTSGPFQWSPDGKAIAWNGGGLRVTEIATGEEKSIAAKRTVTGYAWSPDSRQLAVASLDPGRPTTGFDIVDLATNSHRTVAFAPAEDAGSMINPLIIAGWQPDGRAVLAWVDEYASGSIAEDGLDLWLIPVDRSTPRKLTHTLVKPSWIQWSPNGTQLAIVRSSFRMVFGSERALTVCTTSAECTPITDPNAQTLDPSWSPDGKQIVFVREPPGQQPVVKKGGPAWSALYQTRRLWIANADGTDPHELPAAGRGVASPRWSPDGTHITFVRNRGLWSLDLASDRLTQLVKHIAPIAQTSSTHSYQTNPAPPDWAYEPTDANGMPTWESLVSMTN